MNSKLKQMWVNKGVIFLGKILFLVAQSSLNSLYKAHFITPPPPPLINGAPYPHAHCDMSLCSVAGAWGLSIKCSVVA